MTALGIDVSEIAVAHARSRGATAIEASVFDRVPGAGRWGSAPLLDGNVGIGGCPVEEARMRPETGHGETGGG